MTRDPVFSERFEPARITRLDILLFFAAFFGGLTLYFTLKVLNFGQMAQTTAIVLVMLGYAFAVARVPRLRVRFDQAGDNAYYLGLLFTLASMAVALYEFKIKTIGAAPDAGPSGAEQIIANFGIALASTIVGIFLRVLMHQMRVDPADVESMTRIELAEASKRVKANLDEVSGDMALFHVQVTQRMNNVIDTAVEEVAKALTEFTGKVVESTTALLGETEKVQSDIISRASGVTGKLDAASESAREALERLRKVEPPPLKLASRLEKVCQGLEAVSGTVEALGKTLGASADASLKSSERITAATTGLDALARANREHQAGVVRVIVQAAEALQTSLLAAGTTLQQDKRVLEQIEVRVQKTSEEAQAATLAVLKALTDATRELAALVRSDGRTAEVTNVGSVAKLPAADPTQ